MRGKTDSVKSPLSTGNRRRKVGAGICLLAASIMSSWASYAVNSHVETVAGTNRYTWTVYNQDQSWGLDGFAIEVPAQTRVLAHTIPAPYSNPDGNAYWIMEERHEASVDPHDRRVNVPAPKPGNKLLIWWGEQSPSVYPPGTTLTFSLTTDDTVAPGAVGASVVTYTPQNNPHYYVTFQEDVVGPKSGKTEAATANLTNRPGPRVQVGPVTNPANGHTYYLLTQSTWSNAEAEAVKLGGHLATIRNAQEDQWVYSTFGGYEGALWIGLTDRDKLFSFTWASGEPFSYANWGGGQPDNGTGGVEFYGHIWPPGHSNPPSGKWNDFADAETVLGFPLYGVAEISPVATLHLSLPAPSTTVHSEILASSAAATNAGPELHAYTAIQLTWASGVNKVYRVQWTPSLDQPQWVNLDPPVTGTGAIVSVFDSTREHPQGYYRLQVVR